MRGVLLLITALALSGCAHQVRQQMMAERQQAEAVCEENSNRPELEPLRDAVPTNALRASIGQLASTDKPNDQQKAVIAKMDVYDARCREAVMAYLQRRAPAGVPIYAELIQSTKLLWAKLLADELTFGQFNSERARLASEATTRAEAAESVRVTQAQQLQAQQYQNYLQMQQSINALRPKTTNCYTYGNNVQCTQY